MQLTDKLKDLAVSDTGFVFDPYTGATFSANPVALTVLEGLKQGLDREALLTQLEAKYEIGAQDVERDLEDLRLPTLGRWPDLAHHPLGQGHDVRTQAHEPGHEPTGPRVHEVVRVVHDQRGPVPSWWQGRRNWRPPSRQQLRRR